MDLPSDHIHTKASVFLINELVKEVLYPEQTIQVPAE